MQRGLALFLVLAAVPGLALSGTGSKPRHDLDSSAWTDRYDSHFRKYTKRYFGPGFDWRWFKSQGVAESGLRNNAVSSAGAVGIMQIRPTTYQEIQKKSPYLAMGSLSDPRWNIAAGIFYDSILYKRWLKRADHETLEDDLYMTFASYNAGHSKMLRIVHKVKKKKEEKPRKWEHVKPYAPSQTRHYIDRIRFLMGKEDEETALNPAPTNYPDLVS
jgi:membrane-bound lytic murein transglycosylase MltF